MTEETATTCICHSRGLLGGNPVFSVTSGYPTTDFRHDKNKKRQFIHRLYLESVYKLLSRQLSIVIPACPESKRSMIPDKRK
ncbi:hypothetical protein BMS3Bbin06_00291 [bacterium BMS3Bbin06]|nr:hypothetical protein BMS3Bbin06_00291 [bacterium BMS3Bbin06]